MPTGKPEGGTPAPESVTEPTREERIERLLITISSNVATLLLELPIISQAISLLNSRADDQERRVRRLENWRDEVEGVDEKKTVKEAK